MLRIVSLVFVFFTFLSSPAAGALCKDEAHCYGPIKKTDRLWRLAMRFRPDNSLTLQQMMVAIVALNPHAFQDHNINALRAGSYLVLPNVDQIASIDTLTAEQDVREDNHHWQAPSPRKDGLIRSLREKPSTQMQIRLQEEKRMEDLQAHVQTQLQRLQSDTAALNTALVAMDKQIGNLKHLAFQGPVIASVPPSLDSTDLLTQGFFAIEKYLDSIDFTLWGEVFCLLFITLFIVLQMRRVQNKRKSILINPQGALTVPEEEYDFMGSQEAIPAKLDLAVAYMRMGDQALAVRTLEEIIATGNEDQQNQARTLLLQCKDD